MNEELFIIGLFMYPSLSDYITDAFEEVHVPGSYIWLHADDDDDTVSKLNPLNFG